MHYMANNPADTLRSVRTRPSTEVLLSTLLAGLAELAPMGPARRVISLFAPVMGYSIAWLVRYLVGTYQNTRLCRQIDKLTTQLQQEAAKPATSHTRKKVLENQINDLTQLKQKAMLYPTNVQENTV
jgi:hypothetical protein